jgi:hypothetical protein
MFTSRAAEFYWAEKTEAFETALDRMCPAVLDLSKVMELATVRTGQFKEGICWKYEDITHPKVQIASLEFFFWKITMEIEIVAKESATRVEQELKRTKENLVAFRENIKNDLASLKASSDRVQTETLKMSKEYKQAADLLTSPQFVQAIENAERLATALTAIQKLNQTKINFAVFGNE